MATKVGVATTACLGVLVLFIASGCAFDVSFVKTVPANYTDATGCRDQWMLSANRGIGLGTGFPTKLRQGTKGRCVGHVESGDVFQSNDQIVTVEASNIYEALVISRADRVVGCYLPPGKAAAKPSPWQQGSLPSFAAQAAGVRNLLDPGAAD